MTIFTDLTPENFDSFIMQDEKPVIVDFYVTWVPACLMLKVNLEEAYYQNSTLALFGSINVDTEIALKERFSIITVPTIIVFWKGEVVKQYIGIQEPEILTKLVGKLLGIPQDDDEDTEEDGDDQAK